MTKKEKKTRNENPPRKAIAPRLDQRQVELKHILFDGKKAVLDYPPLWVTVAITGGCAFKCDFCCNHSPDSGKHERTSHQYKMNFMMADEDFEKIVSMCHEASVPHLHICGAGEPFIHPKILKFIDHLIDVYSKTSIQTDFHKALFEKKGYNDEIIKRGSRITFITTDIFGEEDHERIKKGSDFDYLLHSMEKISRHTDILFKAHVILTKQSYRGIPELMRELHRRKVNFRLEFVNLFASDFNPYTSIDNAYMSSDADIAEELERVRRDAEQLGIDIDIPPPFDLFNAAGDPCVEFWKKVQLIPSKNIPKEKWAGNAIPQQCPAVVSGDLFSIGNLFEYDTFMEFWNNDLLVGLRRAMMDGQLPDEACKTCYVGYRGSFRKVGVEERTWPVIQSAYHRLPISPVAKGWLSSVKRAIVGHSRGAEPR